MNKSTLTCSLTLVFAMGLATHVVAAPVVPIGIPSGAKVTEVLNESFTNGTAGSESEPDIQDLWGVEGWTVDMMDHPGDWMLSDVHQAGGSAYLGFDELGDRGAGYIVTPTFDTSGTDAQAFRLVCRAKNINPNAEDQKLQTMVTQDGELRYASAVPMAYDEWTECEWLEKAGMADLRAMIFAWKGKVLIDDIRVELIEYPVSTPRISSVQMVNGGTVRVTWDKVEDATSYYVCMTVDNKQVGETFAGNTDWADVAVAVDGDSDYVVTLVAVNGDQWSMRATASASFTPAQVEGVTALAPVNVTEEGFEAAWTASSTALGYNLYTTVSHTCAGNERFVLLDEDFAAVPEGADDMHPVLVSPLMGEGDMNMCMSRYGWTTDMCIFMRPFPDMPCMVMTDAYKDFGMPGLVESPIYDLSVGGGNVHVSLAGVSGMGDVVLTVLLVNSEGEAYASEDCEVTMDFGSYDLVLPGGENNSRIRLLITDSDGMGQVSLTHIGVSVDLNAGETIVAPLETIRTDWSETSAYVALPVNELNSYSYCVQPWFSMSLVGGVSNSVEIEDNSSVAALPTDAIVAVANGEAIITNPGCAEIMVVSADGRFLHHSHEMYATVALPAGVAIVKVGDKRYKVAR